MSPFPSLSRAGMGRVQFIFAVAVLLVFTVVLIAEVSSYLRLHGTAYAVENAHTLNTLLSQYATDNDGVYPAGEGTRAEGKSEGIALDLLLNSYTPNADVFAVGSTARYAGTAKDYADLAPENISWDFTAGANAATGIKADAPDMLPVLYTTGETVKYHPGEQDLTLSGNGPFGTRGMVVALKSGAVDYRQAVDGVVPAFISPKFQDTGTYTQIKP
jgi:hypothetical protein